MITRRAFAFSLPALLSLSSAERQVFNAINFQRVCKDAEPLRWDERLRATARQHSRRMLDLGFFGHIDPDFGDVGSRLTRAGIVWLHCAENLIREKDHDDPVSLAVVEWMYSPGHRGNLLNPVYTLTGVGMAADAEGRIAITQQFLTTVPYRTAPNIAPRSKGPM